MKVLTVGSAMLDLFLGITKDTLPCEEHKESRQNFMLLEVGRKLELPTIHRCSGGGATNAAVSFSRQGFEVKTFFKTGADCESQFIKKQLALDHIDTSASITTTEAPTGLSLIFPCPGGDRTTITYRGASITLTEQELPLALLHKTALSEKNVPSKSSTSASSTSVNSVGIDCLYVTSLSGATSPLLVPLTKAAHEKKIFVAVNPGSSQLRAGAHDLQHALPFIDVLIMNSFEAHECMTSFMATGVPQQKPVCDPNGPELLCTPLVLNDIPLNLRQYFSEILKRGPKIAVVTNGKEGVYVASDNTLLFHPSLPAEVVNTLGAGDAFGSAFVGALLKNVTIEQALIQGLIQATAVICVLDAQSGLLRAEQLEKGIVDFSKNLMRLFPLKN